MITANHNKRGVFMIAENYYIKDSAILDNTGDIIIKNDVVISDSVKIFTHEHYHSASIKNSDLVTQYGVKIGKIEIEESAYIGAGAIILYSCHRIGRNAVIGAGSIVTRDVDDYSIVAGNPARVIGKVDNFLVDHEDFPT